MHFNLNINFILHPTQILRQFTPINVIYCNQTYSVILTNFLLTTSTRELCARFSRAISKKLKHMNKWQNLLLYVKIIWFVIFFFIRFSFYFIKITLQKHICDSFVLVTSEKSGRNNQVSLTAANYIYKVQIVLKKCLGCKMKSTLNLKCISII